MDHHGLANPRLANAFIARCIASSGRELSLNKTAARLREMGLPVAQETLASLLRYYEESYLVFNLRELFCSLSDNLRAPSKLYATDPGLLAAYSPVPTSDLGQWLETAVFNALRRHHGGVQRNTINRLRFTQRGKCHELDFVVGNALLDGALALVQVTTIMDDEITAHRELIALNSAMERLEVEEGTMVTLDECRDTQTDHGIVHVVLAWE